MDKKLTNLLRFVKDGEVENVFVIDDNDTAFDMIKNYKQVGWSYSIHAVEHIQVGDLPVQHKLFEESED